MLLLIHLGTNTWQVLIHWSRKGPIMMSISLARWMRALLASSSPRIKDKDATTTIAWKKEKQEKNQKAQIREENVQNWSPTSKINFHWSEIFLILIFDMLKYWKTSFSRIKTLIVWILLHQKHGVVVRLRIAMKRTVRFKVQLWKLIPVSSKVLWCWFSDMSYYPKSSSFIINTLIFWMYIHQQNDVFARLCIAVRITTTFGVQHRKLIPVD